MATTVISGNLSQTARELGVSLSALLAANPQLSNPNIIRAGTLLNVPGQDNLSAQESAAQLARVFSNPLVSGASAGSLTGVPGTSFVGTAEQGFTQPTAAGTAPQSSVLGTAGSFATRQEYVPGQGYVPYGTTPSTRAVASNAIDPRPTVAPTVTGLGRSGPTRGTIGTGLTQPAPVAAFDPQVYQRYLAAGFSEAQARRAATPMDVPFPGQTFIQGAAGLAGPRATQEGTFAALARGAAGPLVIGGGTTFIQKATGFAGDLQAGGGLTYQQQAAIFAGQATHEQFGGG